MAEESGSAKKEIFGYEREVDDILQAVSKFDQGILGNVALISDPFSGRTRLVEELKKNLGERVTYVSFNSVMTDSSFMATLRDAREIVIMDNCHFLAMRKIGGFEQMNEFLNFITTSKKFFITTWNTFSWTYLNAVLQIDSYFTNFVTLSPLDADNLKKILLSRYGSQEIEFIDDSAAEERKLRFIWGCLNIKIPFSKDAYCLPWPSFELPGRLHKKKAIPAEEITFERLTRISGGNPGVARFIWDKNIEFPTIWVSSFIEPVFDTNISTNQSFLLSIILSMEHVHYDDLAAIAGPEINIHRALFVLQKKGLIYEEDGYYAIGHEPLKSVINYLKLNRMVW